MKVYKPSMNNFSIIYLALASLFSLSSAQNCYNCIAGGGIWC